MPQIFTVEICGVFMRKINSLKMLLTKLPKMLQLSQKLRGGLNMLSNEKDPFIVVIECIPSKRGYYQVEMKDINGEMHSFIAHEETVLEYRLVEGKELNKDTFEALMNSKEYQKAYSYAINVLAKRMYTEKEISRKLSERATPSGVIDEVIDKLIEIELLNDLNYATLYIENQMEIGTKSQRSIISNLRQKGITDAQIDDLTDLFDKDVESKRITKEIQKAYDRYARKDFSAFELKNKVVQALGRKGFDFYEVGRQYDFFIEDLDL